MGQIVTFNSKIHTLSHNLADLASVLVNIYPELAAKDDQVLMAMAKTFPSELDFGETLICPCMSLILLFLVSLKIHLDTCIILSQLTVIQQCTSCSLEQCL